MNLEELIDSLDKSIVYDNKQYYLEFFYDVRQWTVNYFNDTHSLSIAPICRGDGRTIRQAITNMQSREHDRLKELNKLELKEIVIRLNEAEKALMSSSSLWNRVEWLKTRKKVLEEKLS